MMGEQDTHAQTNKRRGVLLVMDRYTHKFFYWKEKAIFLVHSRDYG